MLVGFADKLACQSRAAENTLFQFYPSRLAEDSAQAFSESGREPYRDIAYLDADLNGTGSKNYVVVGFTNGFMGAISVVQKSPSGFAQVAAPVFDLMAGGHPNLQLLDLDRDGKPEVILSLLAAHGNHVNWVLKWDGVTLTSIGPLALYEGEPVGSGPCNAEFIDLEGDGVLEAVSPPDYGGLSTLEEWRTSERTYDIYRLRSGKYSAAAHSAIYSGGHSRNGLHETDEFIVAAAGAGYRLLVVNGAGNGGNRSSGEIAINGQTVASPSQFGNNAPVVNLPISLRAGTNTIDMRISGPSWASFRVFILKPNQ